MAMLNNQMVIPTVSKTNIHTQPIFWWYIPLPPIYGKIEDGLLIYGMTLISMGLYDN